MMKSPIDQVINSTSGHCITFKANVPVWVPPAVVSETRQRAISECDEDTPAVTATEVVVAPAETSDNDEDGEDEFETALDQAILRILTRNDPSDYKADNTPKVAKVIIEMSPDLRRATATEVSDAFQRLQENIDLAVE